jgi:LmbE family N-acetylglucosaminyl deacetylase
MAKCRNSFLTSIFLIACLFIFLCPQALHSQGKTILILAPHPDDEALCCSGIISAAKLRADTVKVVVITNGDAYTNPPSQNLGYTREAESIAAMGLLGLDESGVIFLGYGDQSLQSLYQSASPTDIFTSVAGQTQTYASRGLGYVDFHTFLYGEPGPYNRQTILGDFKALIQTFQPDEIYTASLIDAHPDHSGTYLFAAEAVFALHQQGLAKMPRIHEFTIHPPCESCDPSYLWPRPAYTHSPPFSAPPDLSKNSQYQWNQIESIPVPASMQDPSPATNLKSRAISQYQSQTGGDPSSWLYSFVKKNEFFRIRNFSMNPAKTNSPPRSAKMTWALTSLGFLFVVMWILWGMHLTSSVERT